MRRCPTDMRLILPYFSIRLQNTTIGSSSRSAWDRDFCVTTWKFSPVWHKRNNQRTFIPRFIVHTTTITMADQSQTAANKQADPSLCKQGCGFFVSFRRVLVSKKTVNERKKNVSSNQRLGASILALSAPFRCSTFTVRDSDQ